MNGSIGTGRPRCRLGDCVESDALCDTAQRGILRKRLQPCAVEDVGGMLIRDHGACHVDTTRWRGSGRARQCSRSAQNSPGTPQQRSSDGGPASSHPAFQPHPIQGWTPDFIPLVLQEAVDLKYYDELIPVGGDVGMRWARELAAKEGIFTGVSGGSTFAIAMQVADRAEPGSVVLCMLPDTGERYLSTPLFEPFGADMSEEELALSQSTPGYQMS